MADFQSRFNDLLTQFPGTDITVANALGVSKQTISAWKSGKRSPKRPAIRTIADYFNVDVAWLMGMTDDRNNDAPFVAESDDPVEQELIHIYRDLNATGQQTLMGTARGLHANPDMKRGSEQNPTAI